MKKISLLWIMAAGLFLFACGGNEEGTENTGEETATTEASADHACCSEECPDDCLAHAAEKKKCQKEGKTASCDKSKCDPSKCDKAVAEKKGCDKSKCDPAKCSKGDKDKVEKSSETDSETTTEA